MCAPLNRTQTNGEHSLDAISSANKMTWSTVSKAADKSSNKRRTLSCLSISFKISALLRERFLFREPLYRQIETFLEVH